MINTEWKPSRITPAFRAVLGALVGASEPLAVAEISATTGLNPQSIRLTLSRLTEAGWLDVETKSRQTFALLDGAQSLAVAILGTGQLASVLTLILSKSASFTIPQLAKERDASVVTVTKVIEELRAKGWLAAADKTGGAFNYRFVEAKRAEAEALLSGAADKSTYRQTDAKKLIEQALIEGAPADATKLAKQLGLHRQTVAKVLSSRT